jgi:hypothetical protein
MVSSSPRSTADRVWTAEEQHAHDTTVLFQFWPSVTDTFTCADGTRIAHNFFRFMGPRLMPIGLPMDLYPPQPGNSVWRTAESLGFDNDYALAYHALLEERKEATEAMITANPWIRAHLTDSEHETGIFGQNMRQSIRQSYGLPRLDALIARAEEDMRRHMATWYRRRGALEAFRRFN